MNILDLDLKEPDAIISYSSGNMAAFRMVREWAELAESVAKKTFIKNKDIFISNIKMKQILLRTFPPISDPVPYRHDQEDGWDQWKSLKSCISCPECSFRIKGYEPLGGCRYNGYGLSSIPRSMITRIPLSCRFTEYRHILFREFGKAEEM